MAPPLGGLLPSASQMNRTLFILGMDPEHCAKLKDVLQARVSDKIEQYHVPAIFAERLGSAHDAEALADRLGVKVVELDSDALESDGQGASYTGMMRTNASAIAAALSET